MVHCINILVYAVLIVINYLVYNFLHSYFNLVILIAQIIFPFISIYLVYFLRRKIKVKVRVAQHNMTKSDKNTIFIDVINPSFSTSLFIKVQLKVTNKFYEDDSVKILEVPSFVRGTNTTTIPINAELLGIVNVKVDKLTIRDIGGFISISKNINSEQEIYVFPDDDASDKYNYGDISKGITESEESNKKGSDFSDVNEIREYIPGDKLMNIHWKLSAKRDILMVKDRLSMSDSQVLVLLELYNSGNQGNLNNSLDDIITLSYQLCGSLIQDNQTVKLVWWSAKEYEFIERRLDYVEDLKEALKTIYYEKTYEDSRLAKTLIAKIRPEIKSYVYVSTLSGDVGIDVIENF